MATSWHKSMIRIFYDRSFHSKAFGENLKELKIRWFYCDVLPTEPAEKICFLSDNGQTLETLDFTIRIGSTPTFYISINFQAPFYLKERPFVREKHHDCII